jgi:glycosyltransferase involved in cell wall biosynthesis
VSNSPIGPAAEILGEEYAGTSGGWIKTEYEALPKKQVEMFFLCTSRTVKRGEIVEKTGEKGTAYCLYSPKISYGIKNPKTLGQNVQTVIDKIKPDIIQIWGTETCLSNIVSRCNKEIPKIVFIQGLLGIHKRYVGGYFSKKENKSLFKGETIFSRFKKFLQDILFKKQADVEIETIKNCKNVIVDNEFSIAYCKALGDDVRAFKHPLLPNKKFFDYSWDISNISKHTIFTVFGATAEKGIHQLLKAVSIVKREYPNVKVVIPGNYPLDKNGKLIKNKNNGYILALYNLLDQLNLWENIEFAGKLNIDEMAQNMCKANVFVNPSCMEVHALSLREATVVGTPCVTSVCGSVLEFLTHQHSALIYRYEEFEVLALYIKKIFADESFAKTLSENGKKAYKKLFETDVVDLIEMYEQSIGENK